MITKLPIRRHRLRHYGALALTACLGLMTLHSVRGFEVETAPPSATGPLQDPLTEIIIRAPEPRYVVPTRRDRIGRIWAPVYINGKGPFRLVLDSGASRSGITPAVADSLQLPLDPAKHVLLRGVTGTQNVATARADAFTVGDLALGPTDLPILNDPMGGADGILGTDRLGDRRITVQFRHDLIEITRSHSERAAPGYLTVPFQLLRGNLLSVDAHVGNVPIKAIIDTGGQVTIANRALRAALDRRRAPTVGRLSPIEGITEDVEIGLASRTPPLRMSSNDPARSIEINYADVTYGDMNIFEHWRLTSEPTMLIGMDALGTLDVLIIDYKRRELQVLMRDPRDQ